MKRKVNESASEKCVSLFLTLQPGFANWHCNQVLWPGLVSWPCDLALWSGLLTNTWNIVRYSKIWIPLKKKERGWGRNLKREKGIEWFGIQILKCDNGMVFEVGIPEKIEKKRDPWLGLVRIGLGVIMIEIWCMTDELKISEKLESRQGYKT